MIPAAVGEAIRQESGFTYAPEPVDVRARMLESLLRTGKLRSCDVCGAVFKPHDRRNVYCSFRCRQEANRYMARQRKRRLA